jgi:FkbM family methyltransferase
MLSQHAQNFLAKSWSERYRTAQFYFRRGLSKLPYLPVPVRLNVAPGGCVDFWWSHVVPYYDANRAFLDYWGHDAGDLRFLWSVLEPGMTFLDVGANQGVYSIVAALRLKGSGAVIAFEPSPREYERLELHFRLNGMAGARAEMLALGAASGRMNFFQVASGDTSRSGLRAPESGDPVNEIPVQSMTLDEYASMRGLDQIDFIKLDVEGGEMDVLRGASKALLKFRPVLLCEVLDAATAPWGYPARDIVGMLEGIGYRWFEVNDDGSLAPHVRRTEYPAIENYAAIPAEKCASLGLERGV